MANLDSKIVRGAAAGGAAVVAGLAGKIFGADIDNESIQGIIDGLSVAAFITSPAIAVSAATDSSKLRKALGVGISMATLGYVLNYFAPHIESESARTMAEYGSTVAFALSPFTFLYRLATRQ
jgi:hypothetical protein